MMSPEGATSVSPEEIFVKFNMVFFQENQVFMAKGYAFMVGFLAVDVFFEAH